MAQRPLDARPFILPRRGTALGYALAALLFLGARWFTVPRAEGEDIA